MLNKTMTVDSFAEANSKPKSEDAQTPRAENERESSANFSSGESVMPLLTYRVPLADLITPPLG